MRPATSRTFEAVCEELDRRRRVTLGFERIEKLLSILGNPERELRAVQLVGTNGKGTTAAGLAAALEAAGQPSGAYLSPHVLSYTERVMVEGKALPEEEFASVIGETIEAADANHIPASQFELLTAGALAAFRDRGLQWAVLEAGLGARHDATSVAGAEMVVLTNVGLDHAEYLGDTVEEISTEKLASLQPGSILVLGTDDARVVEIARKECARVGARLAEYQEARQAPSGVYKTGSRIFPYSPERSDPSEATHLARNARLAARAAEMLLGRPLRREEREATSRVRLPARFEEHEVRGTPVVVDGGHNPEALLATLEAVRRRYGGRPLGIVFGVLWDKDAGRMLDLLAEAHSLVLTRPVGAGGRAAEPASLAHEHDPRDARGRRARVVEEPGDALLVAVEEVEGVRGVVLVTGSLYTAAGVLGGLRGDGRD